MSHLPVHLHSRRALKRAKACGLLGVSFLRKRGPFALELCSPWIIYSLLYIGCIVESAWLFIKLVQQAWFIARVTCWCSMLHRNRIDSNRVSSLTDGWWQFYSIDFRRKAACCSGVFLVFVLPQKSIRKRVLFTTGCFLGFCPTSSKGLCLNLKQTSSRTSSVFMFCSIIKNLYFVQFMPFVAPLEGPVFVELTCTSTLQISNIPTKSRFVTHFLS